MARWRVSPATPLTFFLLIAFILLLLSTLSTPVIKSIPLGSYLGTNYGVFGYCTGNVCPALQIGYALPDLNSGVPLGPGSRHTLSSILIVHPVAAFMTLVCTLLAAASHFRGPSHSPRFLLALLILTFPTLLISLLAFLVDILLFIPHMRWGGWIVLAATIIITGCSVMTCAMRRTLVSRKARKKRIEENADMNGSNFYAMQNATRQQQSTFPRAESPPPLTSSDETDANKLPQFATFQVSRPDTTERTPLNAREPSETTQSTMGRLEGPVVPTERQNLSGTTVTPHAPIDTTLAGMPGAFPNTSPIRPTSGAISPIEDAASNPRMPRGQQRRSPPRPGYDGMPPSDGPLPVRANDPRMPPPFYGRGRGSYPPPRGTYPPRGGMYPPRGSHGRDGSRPMPPPGWNVVPRGMPQRGMMRGRAPPPGYPRRPMSGRPMPPDQYGYADRSAVPMPHAADFGGQRSYSGGPPVSPQEGSFDINVPRQDGSPNETPVVMESPTSDYNQETFGSHQLPTRDYTYSRGPPVNNLYDERAADDSPVANVPQSEEPAMESNTQNNDFHPSSFQRDPASFGFSGLRPSGLNRLASPPVASPISASNPYATQAGDLYDMNNGNPSGAQPTIQSTEQMPSAELDSRELGATAPMGEHPNGMYLPRNAYQPEPIEIGDSSPRRPVAEVSSSPIDYHSAAELPDRASPPRNDYNQFSQMSTRTQPPRHRTTSSDVYIEDVEPRFAVNESALPLQQSTSRRQYSGLDSGPGPYAADPAMLDVPNRSGNRSPAQSDDAGSNFTSISQRQINPNWRPPPGMGPGFRGPPPSRRYEPDSVLASNPDFSLPGASPIARRPVGGGPSRSHGASGSDGLMRATQGSHQYYDGL